MEKKPDIGKCPGVGPINKNVRLTPNRCFFLVGLYCILFLSFASTQGHYSQYNTVQCRVKVLVCWVTDKRFINRLLQQPYNTPPLERRVFRSRPDVRVDVSPTRGSNIWGPWESIFQVRHGEIQLDFFCFVRFELATQNPCPAVDAIC